MSTAEPIIPGRLVIISGPSGSGKSSVLKRLLNICELPLELSVSATTRSPRPGEEDGVHYDFMQLNEFERKVANSEFLEYIEVYPGTWYGTLRETVTTGIKTGKWIILEIDVRGAMSVIESIDSAITIFIDPGSVEELERRLRSRGTETEEKIQRRLEVAQIEMRSASRYQHVVINKNIEQTARQICQLLKEFGESTSCTTN